MRVEHGGMVNMLALAADQRLNMFLLALEEDLALVHWLLIHLESQLLTLLIMVFFLNVFLIQREYRCQILILISAWKKEIA